MSIIVCGNLTNHTGFALINHLIQQKRPTHLSVALLTAVQHLLSDMQHASDELRGGCCADVLQSLLLDPLLWAAAEASVQHHMHAACMAALEVRACLLWLFFCSKRANPWVPQLMYMLH